MNLLVQPVLESEVEPDIIIQTRIRLLASPRRLAALVPVNNNYSGDRRESCHDEAKRLQIVSQPPEDQHVADRDSDCGQDDDEK